MRSILSLLRIAVFCILPIAVRAQTQTTYVLTGTIVTARDVIPNGKILIDGDRIKDIGASVSAPEGTPVIDVDGVIFPGLIDLHNHLSWNISLPGRLAAPVAKRYEWQALDEYAARLSGPEGQWIAHEFGCDMERYAEVKGLLGG